MLVICVVLIAVIVILAISLWDVRKSQGKKHLSNEKARKDCLVRFQRDVIDNTYCLLAKKSVQVCSVPIEYRDVSPRTIRSNIKKYFDEYHKELMLTKSRNEQPKEFLIEITFFQSAPLADLSELITLLANISKELTDRYLATIRSQELIIEDPTKQIEEEVYIITMFAPENVYKGSHRRNNPGKSAYFFLQPASIFEFFKISLVETDKTRKQIRINFAKYGKPY